MITFSKFMSSLLNESSVGVDLGANVAQWYKERFPKDSFADKINKDITFNGVYKALENGDDIYEVIGVVDSDVRTNIFNKLASIMKVPTDHILGLWHNA